MCGRYSLYDPEDLYEYFSVVNRHLVREIIPHYQIPPATEQPVIVKHSPNQIEYMTWGITPKWERGKVEKKTKPMINARSETMFDNSFKQMAQSQRGLVGANGFFEWKATPEGKIPYYIHLKARRLFALTVIYDVWTDAEGREHKEFAIITTAPNSLMEPIHNRMPVIMKREDEEAWLNPDKTEKERLLSLLAPYPTEDMEAYPISRAVNNSRYDAPDIIQPVSLSSL